MRGRGSLRLARSTWKQPRVVHKLAEDRHCKRTARKGLRDQSLVQLEHGQTALLRRFRLVWDSNQEDRRGLYCLRSLQRGARRPAMRVSIWGRRGMGTYSLTLTVCSNRQLQFLFYLLRPHLPRRRWSSPVAPLVGSGPSTRRLCSRTPTVRRHPSRV